MAFSTITADPTWGTPVTGTSAPVLRIGNPPPIAPLFDGQNAMIADLGAVLGLGNVNTSGMVKPFAGWITYTGDGGGDGGGSTRPTSGMLYPRGQG